MSETSKNINHGEINAGGAVIIGDNNEVKIQHILGNLQDYQNLEQEIEEAREVFNAIGLDKQEVRLKLSGTLEAKKEKLENIKKAIVQAFEYINKLTISTDRLDQAKALFLEGDIPGALGILKDEAIQADYQALQTAKKSEEERHSRRMEEIAQKTKGIAEEWKMKAVLMATRYEDGEWFEKTKGYYEKALEVDRGVKHIFAYAFFLHKHNQYTEATPLYREALQIYRTLAQSNPEVFLQYVAGTLNNLGLLHRAKNELELAQGEYEEALQIYRTLAKSNPEAFLKYMAQTLNNLAIVHSAKNELELAQGEYEEALQIYRILTKNTPDAFLPDVAGTLNNLALLHHAKNELELAQGEYEESLQIRRTLAKKPDAFLPDVAQTLNNLANLHSDKNELELAQGEYEEALQIRRALAKSNPNAFLPDVAHTASNMALFYQDNQPDRERSLELVKEALRAAMPFGGYLKFAQDSIESAKLVIEEWGLDVEAFLKELEKENK
ncbi:tetratricopeptide repeat protein [Haliscomenobacter sp.]|uniref:tetratricopeptide repeat protein n=1 Tax=Haliscomenobacter sp. TaxID=2717303 RepID=UPI003BA9A18C